MEEVVAEDLSVFILELHRCRFGKQQPRNRPLEQVRKQWYTARTTIESDSESQI